MMLYMWMIFSMSYKITLIFWMMTERKMQSFLKKHFMRKRIWIHRCKTLLGIRSPFDNPEGGES